MNFFFYIFLITICYIWGSISVGYYYYRWKTGRDIRFEPEPGSGSTGWSNAKRLLGIKESLPVFAADLTKGALPATIGLCLFHNDLLAAIMGFAATIGHIYSCLIPFPKFHAGKGVASSAGITIVFFVYYLPFWPWAILALIIGIAAWTLTGKIITKIKKAEKAALTSFMMLTVVFLTGGIMWLYNHLPFSWYFVTAIAGMALIGWAHRPNFIRALSSKKKKLAIEQDGYK